MINIAVSTGEISGEHHLANVLSRLNKNEFSFFGMGSETLKKSGVEIIIDSKKWANLNGFNLPVIIYKSLYALLVFLINLVKRKPDALILVDYPGFNMTLAVLAKLLKIKTIYFIPPKIWAWRESRIKKIKKYIDEIIVIFPFEVDFYNKYNFKNVYYLGHPFSDFLYPEDKSKIRKELELEDKISVALFPGSRRSEITFLINVIKNVVDKYSNIQFVVSVAKNFTISDFTFPKTIKLVENNSIKVMQACDYGILKCGTCNLEAAFIELPHTVIYKVSNFSAKIIRKYIKIPFYSLVNIILANTTKELIQEECTEENIINELDKLIIDNDYKNKQIQSFKKIKEILGYQDNVCKKIADKIAHIVYEK